MPPEEPRVLREDADAAAGYEPEQPLDIVQQTLESPIVETKELIPDRRVVPPDEAVARSELLEENSKDCQPLAQTGARGVSTLLRGRLRA